MVPTEYIWYRTYLSTVNYLALTSGPGLRPVPGKEKKGKADQVSKQANAETIFSRFPRSPFAPSAKNEKENEKEGGSVLYSTVFNFEPEPRFDPGLNPGLNPGSGLGFSTRVRV
jgi:hypothetical protein